MWKRMAATAAVVVAVGVVGSPAFAAAEHGQGASGWGHHHHGGKPTQIGLINVGDVDLLHSVNGVLGLCGNDATVLGGVVPILSPNPTTGCVGGGILGGDSHN